MSESSTLPSDSTSGLNSPSSKSRRLLIVGAVIVAIVAVGAVVKITGGIGGSRAGTIAAKSEEPNNSRIASGTDHTCTIRDDATVWCWGWNFSSQLARNITSPAYSSTPIQVPPSKVSGAQSVAAGDGHTCALLANSQVKCWGDGDGAQLGNGASFDAVNPVSVMVSLGPDGAPFEDVEAIAAGRKHTCALKTGGTVWCWGDNRSSQMGLPWSNGGQLTPRMVSQLDSVVAISAGGDTTCALLSDTSVKCWGSNNDGALGIGTYRVTSSETPLNVVRSETDNRALNNVVAISVGDNHTCILDASRHASCWGYNGTGQLGNNPALGTTPFAATSAPVRVDSDEEFSTISAGGLHTCAILESTKAVQCWGNNNKGQLGDGTTKNRDRPVAVSGDGNANVELGLGARFSCSLASNAAIRCWGLNNHGELGNGTTNNRDTAGYVIFD